MRLTRSDKAARRIRAAAFVFVALLAATPLAADDLVKAGTVEISQVQIAFIGSANLGGGTLHFNGNSYDFSIGGLGVGGMGASSIEATGEVYNMTDPSQFEGAYGQARYGAVVGDTSTGELWLQNSAGVYMHLQAERAGLMLSLGGDIIIIKLD
ncbi:MAG: hypothetical protein WD044_05405 [Dongiaceae bacterium]